MNVMDTEINFTALADEIGVDTDVLPILFDALKRECEKVFPMLAHSIALQDFTEMHEYAHALKGIIGNMRLDDLHIITTNFDNAAKVQDKAFLYEDNLSVLKDQLNTLFKSFYVTGRP